MPSPRTDAPRVKRLEVEPGQSLAPLAEELNGFLAYASIRCVLEKSPLVYVNFNRTQSAQRFCSVINHGTTPGTVRIRTGGAQWQCVLDSSRLSGRSVRQRKTQDTLELDLDPGAAAAFSVKPTFRGRSGLPGVRSPGRHELGPTHALQRQRLGEAGPAGFTCEGASNSTNPISDGFPTT